MVSHRLYGSGARIASRARSIRALSSTGHLAPHFVDTVSCDTRHMRLLLRNTDVEEGEDANCQVLDPMRRYHSVMKGVRSASMLQRHTSG